MGLVNSPTFTIKNQPFKTYHSSHGAFRYYIVQQGKQYTMHIYIAKLSYFTNLDFPEIAEISPYNHHHLGEHQVVWGL